MADPEKTGSSEGNIDSGKPSEAPKPRLLVDQDLEAETAELKGHFAAGRIKGHKSHAALRKDAGNE